MTIGELQEKDLIKIANGFCYCVFNGVYNIFHCGEHGKLEPITLHELLILMSNRVSIGNNFAEVANCLDLPDQLQYDARLYDEALYEYFY